MPAAHQLGVAGIELEASGELTPANLTQTGRREILHLLRSHDLTVSAIVCPLRRGIDVAQNIEPRLEYIRDTMKLAFDLGPRLVIVPIGQLPEKEDDPAAAVFKESLRDLGQQGDRTGVTIALDNSVDSPEALVAYLGRFDIGSLGVSYNPANVVLAGFNPYDAIKTLNKRLVYAQAQDARRVSPSRLAAVPIGHGDLDWMQILAHFEEIEYRGALTVLGNDRAELAAGAAFLRRFVA
ncbi:MAG: sugar phosphate isomerase/epimerase [Planctomycetes bacterium]|nr:sugar phosphate isomerase/epimerase [Planctomycetota bacterium]